MLLLGTINLNKAVYVIYILWACTLQCGLIFYMWKQLQPSDNCSWVEVQYFPFTGAEVKIYSLKEMCQYLKTLIEVLYYLLSIHNIHTLVVDQNVWECWNESSIIFSSCSWGLLFSKRGLNRCVLFEHFPAHFLCFYQLEQLWRQNNNSKLQ